MDDHEGAEPGSTLRCINDDQQQKMQEQPEERKMMICINIRQEIEKLATLIVETKQLKKCKKYQNHINKMIKMKYKLIKDLKSMEGSSNVLNNEILKKRMKTTCKWHVDGKESKYCDSLQSLTRQLTKKEAQLNEERNITQELNYKNHVLKQMLTKVASEYHQLNDKYKNEMEIKDNELKHYKVTAHKKMYLQDIKTQEAELKNKLKIFEIELRKYEMENQLSSSNDIETTKEEESKNQAAQGHESNMQKYLAELQERLSKLETKSRETQMKIEEKDRYLQQKIQENKCLQNELSSTTIRANDIKNSLCLKLQVEFLDKEHKYQEATGEKLRSLQEKLSEAKEELQNSMSQKISQEAEHTETLETLRKEISICKQKINSLEEQKLQIINKMEHESVNRKNCDDLKRKLEKVTQDRDEKIQEISTFVKLFDDLKILADASAAEKIRLTCENIVLQKEANEARLKLEERDNLQSPRSPRVQVINLQDKYDMLTAKLNKCEEVIKRFNIESEKLHKENQDQAQNILKLKHHITVLNDNLSIKEKEIAITEQNCHTQNNVDLLLKESVYECTKLKKLAENLYQHNNELIEKCKLLENDLEQFEIKLKTSTKQLSSVEEEKKDLIKSMNELTNENSSLHEATNQLAILEMEKSSQNEKLNHLTDNCNKLDEELRILRKELITSQETNHVLEKQNEVVMKIQADVRSRFCTLTEDKQKLRDNLVSESSQRRKLYIEAERLKCIQASMSSNVEKISKENYEISKLLAQREAKIENLQVLNKKFVKKFKDLESSYNKDMARKKSEAIENAKECTSLRLKNQGLISKVMNHIRKNKQMKDKCRELHNETENQTNQINNLKREKEEIQVENEKLKLERKATHRKEQATQQREVVQMQSKKKPPSQQPKRESIPSRTLRASTRVKQLVKRD